MPAPLILRIIEDATSVFKTNDAVVSSMTRVGDAALATDADFKKAAAGQVASSLRVEKALEGQIVAYRELAQSATSSAAEQAKATQLGALASERLARAQGLVVTGTRGVSTSSKTAEQDIGKLTRGALAGSGVISSLGRSLAFASGGFIAVAGTATLLHNAISEALSFAATQKQVTAQLKTSGLSFGQYKDQIDASLSSESKLSGFTRQDLLQSFGYLVRVSGNVGESLKLDAVAADVARGRHIALSSASIALAKALGGSSTALRRLGIIVPKTATGMDALRYVAAKFQGQAESGATSADHLHASLVNASEVIGTALLPTFNRLASSFSGYISKLEESGRLQRDVNEAVTLLGYGFHTLEGIIKRVDDATGGFSHTLGILVALEFGKIALGWASALRVLAGEWGLVGAAATRAGVAQSAALAEGGAGAGAGAAVGAESGGIGALLSGGLAGKLIGARGRGFFASRAAAAEIGGFGAEAGGAAAVSATGVGALAVAAVAATAALDDLAKKGAKAAGLPPFASSGIDDLAGVLTGGLVGNYRYGILGQALHGFPGFGPGPPPPAPLPSTLQSNLGLSSGQLFGNVPSQATFGQAKPMTQYWKTWVEGFKLTQAALMATLTKSNVDDVAVARRVVAQVKRQIDEGVLSGPALTQALQAEAAALSTIWSAEAQAAQKRAAAAAAAKQKIITDIQNAINPIRLQVALAKAQSLGQTGAPQLKDQLSAAYKGLAKALASGNQQLILQAYQQIKAVKDAIKSAVTTAASTFSVPAKLALDIARDQALGKGITDDLREEKRALYKWISSHRKNIQGVTDAYNQITAINSQLTSGVVSAYGDYKKASLKAETAGLGLTRAQRQALEARLSQRGPGGTHPESGTGAAGYVIDPETGRPVHVGHQRRRTGSRRIPSAYGGTGPGGQFSFDFKIYLDGKQLTNVVTKGQQGYRKSNPASRRGPHAGTQTA